MLVETLKIIAADRRQVLAESGRGEACRQCQAGNGCGHYLFSRLKNDRRVVALPLPDDAPAWQDFNGDQRVDISLGEAQLMRQALLLYLPPLLMMMAGALIAGKAFGGGDGTTLAGAGVGLAAGLWLAALGGRRFWSKGMTIRWPGETINRPVGGQD